MTIEQIKSKIIEANYYYRIGEPIMPDYKYDELVEKLDEKLKLRDLALTLAYNSKTNYTD
jgi:NAD-dependent DNA ligase